MSLFKVIGEILGFNSIIRYQYTKVAHMVDASPVQIKVQTNATQCADEGGNRLRSEPF